MTSKPDRQELEALFGAQYSRGDVVLALGITEKALEHMVRPGGPVRIHGLANPGTGRARMFVGRDILNLEVARRIGLLGLPHRASTAITEVVGTRLNWGMGGLGSPDHYAVVLYPMKIGGPDGHIEWHYAEVVGGPEEPWTPSVSVLVDVDRIISQTITKLRALRDGTAMPTFDDLMESVRWDERHKPKPKRDLLKVATPGFEGAP